MDTFQRAVESSGGISESVSGLRKQIESIRERHERELTVCLEGLNEIHIQSDSLKSQSIENKETFTQQQQVLEDLKAQRAIELTDHEAQLTQLRLSASEAEDKLKLQVVTLQNENGKLLSEMEALRKRSDMLERDKNTLTSQLTAAQEEYEKQGAELKQREKAAKAASKNFQLQIRDLEAEQAKMSEKTLRLVTENEELTLHVRQLQQEVEEHIRLAGELAAEKEQNKILIGRLSALETEGNSRDTEKEETIARLTQELIDAKMEAARYANEADVESKRVAQLTRALSAHMEEEHDSTHGKSSTSDQSASVGSSGKKFKLSETMDRLKVKAISGLDKKLSTPETNKKK